MEIKNNRPTEWVSYQNDPTKQPMFVLKENGETVDLQVPGTDSIIEGVSKKTLRPLDSSESYDLNAKYGLPNTQRTIKLDDGSLKKLQPIEPRPAFVMATISRGPVLVVSLNGTTCEVEDLTGKQLPYPLNISDLRILPKAIGEELRKQKTVRISEILNSQPITQNRWDWGSRGYTTTEKVNNRELPIWPTIRQGEIHTHKDLGPCVVLSTTHGFEGETWAKVRKIGFYEGQVVVENETSDVYVQERRTNGKNASFLFVHFRWTDKEFRNQLEKVPEVAEILKKIRPTNKTSVAKK